LLHSRAQAVEDAWFSQLADHGRLVMPLACKEGVYCLYVREKDSQKKEGYQETWHDYCRFVPLLPGVKKQ
jgi:protein-L-isoaspartate(D-aspartate) O-methyltransferase